MNFDPVTGKLIDRDALASVAVKPSGFRRARTDVTADGRKRTEVIHEDDGGTAAINLERPDGRVAVEAFPRAPEMGTI